MPHRLEAVDGGGAAQHADIFVVELQQLVPAQTQRVHPRPGQGRKLHGVPAHLVEDSGYLRRGGPVEALILFQQQAHEVVDLDGRVRQSRETAPAVGCELGHEVIVPVEPQTVGVGEGPARPRKAARMIARRHGGRDLQHDVRGGAGELLAGVDGGRELGVAEQVHHALIADAVAAAELPMGVVVGHAPAEAAGHPLLGDGVVEDSGIAQRLCQTVRLVVEGLGRELCSLELADEVAFPGVGGDGSAGLAADAPAPVGVVGVGVDILQKLAAAGAAGARRGAGGVEAADRLVGALIEALVVGAAADPDAPEEDAGMAAALADHLAAVLQRLRFPDVVAHILPAGHLHKDQQTQLVAGVEESGTGGHREPDGVAAQLLFQQLGVQTLDAVRHGIALIGVALRAVEAPQLHPLAVEIKPPGHEL